MSIVIFTTDSREICTDLWAIGCIIRQEFSMPRYSLENAIYVFMILSGNAVEIMQCVYLYLIWHFYFTVSCSMFIMQVADIDSGLHVAAILLLCLFTTFDVTSRRQLSFRPVFKFAILGQHCFLSIPHNISTKNYVCRFPLVQLFYHLPPPPPPPPHTHPPREKSLRMR